MKKILCLLLFSLFLNFSVYAEEVVVYTSLDQNFSEPILKEFEKKTGITVKAVYDVEATKTTGLVNRLIAEKNRPKADVFWNSEVGRTIVLKRKGILTPYASPSASDIPATFKDNEGYWTGFAARARVLIYNKTMIKEEDLPQSILELTDKKWSGKFCMAYPLFGTTATHSAALFVALGDEKAKEYFKALKENDMAIVDGNGPARDRVVDGVFPFGFTDTDDANGAIQKGKPVDMFFPDKEGMGTLLIPNTVGLVANGPNIENGKKFIDYLLSREVESNLAFSGSLQMPLRSGVNKPKHCPDYKDIKAMEVDFEAIADKMDEAMNFLKELFIR